MTDWIMSAAAIRDCSTLCLSFAASLGTVESFGMLHHHLLEVYIYPVVCVAASTKAAAGVYASWRCAQSGSSQGAY